VIWRKRDRVNFSMDGVRAYLDFECGALRKDGFRRGKNSCETTERFEDLDAGKWLAKHPGSDRSNMNLAIAKMKVCRVRVFLRWQEEDGGVRAARRWGQWSGRYSLCPPPPLRKITA
jgi:hypothetical protein